VDLDDVEIEARRVFERDLAPGPRDEALDRAAVEWALSRVRQPATWGARVRSLLRSKAGWVALSGVAGLAVALLAARPKTDLVAVAGKDSPARAPVAQALVLKDGSEIEPDDAQRGISIAEQTPTRTTVRMRTGSARFRVRHDPRRVFRVDAGAVQIEDLGTVFQVAHRPDGRVRVRVMEGHVAVVWPGDDSRVELGAGDDRVFPPAAPASQPRAEAAPDAPPSPSPPSLAKPSPPARRGAAANGPAHLLLTADEARRAGRPADAVTPLKRMVATYPADPRAPSAAFTLGWILLTDLGRPREAALAFIQAERIAPRGTLAEDAAARVAESWQKAGDAPRARAAARHYQQTYPAGRYVRLVEGITGQR